MINRVRRLLKSQLKKIYSKSNFKRHVAKFRVTQASPSDKPENMHPIQFSVDQISRGQIAGYLNIEGWLHSTAPVFDLLVEIDGEPLASFQPSFVRQDVSLAFPTIDPTLNVGFSVQLQIPSQYLSLRGVTEAKLYYRDADRQELLAGTFIFQQGYYQATQQTGRAAFYFTVASSNISLGGFGDFKEKLAPFALGHCQLGFMAPVLYLRSTLGAQHDWQFDPEFDETRLQPNGKTVLADSLQSILNYAIEHQVPCVIGLNGGIWGDAAGSCPEWDLTDRLEENIDNCQWNQDNQVMPDDYLQSLSGAEQNPELSRALTLSHYNDEVRSYKKRNLQQAGQQIVEFVQQHPQLYIGSNLDPDCYHNPFFEGEQWYDYNPQTVAQFRDWLAGSGTYQAELQHTINHIPFSLSQLNAHLNSNYQQWSEVEPPRKVFCLPCAESDKKLLTLWEHFRRHLVQRHYTDLTDWLIEIGVPGNMIFSSQGFTAPRSVIDPFALALDSPIKNYDTGGMSLAGSKPDRGHIGAILYGESARNNIRTENQQSFFENILKLDSDWAVVEFNPADLRDDAQALPDYDFAWDCLREMFNHGARFVNLMAWNGSSGKDNGAAHFNAHMALRDTPLEHAVIDFMLMHADVARGEQCYTFGTQRYACLDGWSATVGKLKATTQGLRISFSRGSVELCAPQPYLYAGMTSIEIEVLGMLDSDIELKLVANGCVIVCEQQMQEKTTQELSRYRLIVKQALLCKMEHLILRIIAPDTVKQLRIHRIIFKH